MEAVEQLAPVSGTAPTCAALGVARATLYRQRNRRQAPRPRPGSSGAARAPSAPGSARQRWPPCAASASSISRRRRSTRGSSMKIVPSEPINARDPCDDHAHTAHGSTPARISWARVLKRVFEIDIEHCPHCGGNLKIIAAIEDPAVIVGILTHLNLPARAPPRSPVRAFPCSKRPDGAPGMPPRARSSAARPSMIAAVPTISSSRRSVFTSD